MLIQVATTLDMLIPIVILYSISRKVMQQVYSPSMLKAEKDAKLR
jgi:hypothetical protein